jgi:hypothetical protein
MPFPIIAIMVIGAVVLGITFLFSGGSTIAGTSAILNGLKSIPVFFWIILGIVLFIMLLRRK